MQKQASYFISVLLFVLLVTVLLSFIISFQMITPKEEEVPRRSRPVSGSVAKWHGGISDFGKSKQRNQNR